jgi:hypothetical protein
MNLKIIGIPYFFFGCRLSLIANSLSFGIFQLHLRPSRSYRKLRNCMNNPEIWDLSLLRNCKYLVFPQPLFFPSDVLLFLQFFIYFYARFHQFPTARTSKHPFFSDSPRKPPTETLDSETQQRHSSTYYLPTTSHVRNSFIDSISKGII